MNITITKNLIKKISIMEHILSLISKDDKLINGILCKCNGMMQAANRTLNMSFKLSAEELGLAPIFPTADFILPEMAYRFLKNLEVNTSVDINIVGDNKIEIITNTGNKRKKNKAEFATQPAEDYAAIAKSDAASMQKLNSAWFKSAIAKCSYAISDNMSKPIYTAAHLVAKNGTIVSYAIDGFKAAVVFNKTDKAEKDFMLSIPQEIIKILGNVDCADTVIVGYNDSHTKAVFVTDDSTVIQGSLYTGSPIMYDNFLNKGTYSFSLKTKELSRIIKQICLFNATKTSTTSPMKMLITKSDIICSFSNERTKFEDVVSIEGNVNEREVLIGMNPDSLLATLKNCVEETTTFKYSDPLSPLEVYNGDLSAIVVPMRISSEG